MKLEEIISRYKKGTIDKWSYIDEMYSVHEVLFEYAAYLSKTNISNISITDQKVVMEFRNSGIKFICSQSDKRLAPFDTLNFGSYELEEINMQLELIGDSDTIFDIGANFGWYALHIANKRSTAKILSFEPIPTTFEHLRENIKINKMENISLLNIGFSNKEGEFDFYFDPTLSVNASLQNLTNSKDVKVVKCKVQALDQFVQNNNITKIDFIKCDVEGAELFVFQGGIESIRQFKPIIFSEMLRKWAANFNYHPNDIIKLLSECGYACYVIESAGKLKEIITVTEDTKETNFIFLHSEKHQDKISKYTTN